MSDLRHKYMYRPSLKERWMNWRYRVPLLATLYTLMYGYVLAILLVPCLFGEQS